MAQSKKSPKKTAKKTMREPEAPSWTSPISPAENMLLIVAIDDRKIHAARKAAAKDIVADIIANEITVAEAVDRLVGLIPDDSAN
jgi:hypothetical protein